VPTGSFAHRCYAFTSFNQVKTVSETGTTLTYTYDEDHRRETVVKAGANPGFREYFPVAGVESERRFNHDNSGNVTSVEWADYIMLGGELVGEYAWTNVTGGTKQLLYFHNDAQGTVTAITGDVTEEDSVDAWGKERNLNGTPDAGVNGSGGGSTCSLETTDAQSRGWLGQESLAKSGICIKDLNARLYDPLTASFASADTVIGHPFSTQGWNRYAYGGNNPLANADPTGMCFGGCFWKNPLFRDVIGIAAAIALDQWYLPGAEIGSLQGFINAGVSGSVSGAISTGTLKGTLIATGEALAFNEVGNLKANWGIDELIKDGGSGAAKGLAESALMHGAVGGLVSVAQGGKFQSGFIAAGFGDLAGPQVTGLAHGNIYLGTAASAVTGGIGSVLGGGKFENGAVTGAFGYLFNDLADHRGLYTGTAGGVLAGGSIAGGCTLASAGICALGPAEILGGGFIGLGILAGET
jgi:RHS repeat-associated protein